MTNERIRSVYLILLFVVVAAQAQAQGLSKPSETALIEAENQVTAKRGETPWQKATPVLPLAAGDQVQTGERSRATVRLTAASVLRLDELSTVEIVPPVKDSGKPAINLFSGAIYFFSRAKAHELEVLTPAVVAALRGTELVVKVEQDGRTRITMLDGEVEMHNDAGSVVLQRGEQGEAEVGRAPRKTAMIDATNLIQWALYYPAVVYPPELDLGEDEQLAVSASLAAYREGDLLGALEKYPSNHRPTSAAGRLYRAAVLLAVGRVDAAQTEMAEAPQAAPGRRALEQLIAAVRFQHGSPTGDPQSAGEWLAESYYLQSRGQLEPARSAAQRATEQAPNFGYAWVRLAELEFSFGHTSEALQTLARGLELSPRNAQGHALRGFLLSAQNRIAEGRTAFDEALRLDGALGNAWLGRGLTLIREGNDEAGRRDLQAAAVLEPNRSLFHSYLGKAFSQSGEDTNARHDLTRARDLDPNDPTPWLYTAIKNKQDNRYNDAIADLEKSVALNDNRSVFRSRFLLDQDRSIRGTNLAAIYLNDGLPEQSEREAVRAVAADYGSAPAHLFLANSYDAKRDPTRINLRYETAWFNELLLSNLLSPVGGGPLSQFVSEQEYSKMFEGDGFGINSVTDYSSKGEWREVASQYGTFGNFSYAVDMQYQHNDGIRPNNRLARLETYAQFKLQLGPQDTLFFQTKFEDLKNGDIFQRYDPRTVDTDPSALTFNFHEKQEPALMLLGWHREWSPENHTLLLIGRLANRQMLTSQDTTQAILTRDVSSLTQGLSAAPADFNQPFNNPQIFGELRTLVGRGQIQGIGTTPLDSEYGANFQATTAELQQIVSCGPSTFILGGRYQNGAFDTKVRLMNRTAGLAALFDSPAAHQDFAVGLDRVNLYGYNLWRVAPWLSLTGGVTYDRLQFPDNFRSPPINDRGRTLERLSPKAGFILQPTPTLVVRGAYTEAISGASFDESIRLEPTQVAGFTQAYRSLASESLIGSVAGSRYQLWGLSVEQKLSTRTYLGLGFDELHQRLDRTIGVFDFLDSRANFPNEILPSSLAARDQYCEQVYHATIHQLVGENWSLGVVFQTTRSDFKEQLPELQAALRTAAPNALAGLARNAEKHLESQLHELSLSALYNHPSGFFAKAEANWFSQNNEGFQDPHLGDDFWQFNVYGGYRFCRNRWEVHCDLLNLGGTDYRLEPLTPYAELARDRTLVVRVKFNY